MAIAATLRRTLKEARAKARIACLAQACASMLLASALTLGLAASAAAQSRSFVVGGKAFTEQYVLAEITKQLLEKAGVPARTRVGYGTDTIREAQLAGEVDIAWDYTWTGYSMHLGFTEPRDPDAALAEVRETDRANGLIWLERSSVNNTYALAVNLDFAAENCIHSVEDLAQALRNGAAFRMASDQECHKRADCLLGAERAYNFKVAPERIAVMNVAETHEALRERRAEIAVVYTTDGKIPAYDLELLEDPRGVFNAYYLVPVVSARALEEEPRLKPILERIARSLDTATSQDLHYRVDIVGQPVDQVARYFIASKGL
ncbi:MAG: glycine betaine ABC transporter substrate-binding protein [Pseudomonadota bacterium]